MIGRVYLFTYWLVFSATLVLIALMILRLTANIADLNPFTWSALTIRRLTEPIIAPVRRALVRFPIGAKYAPIVVILLAILFAWLVLDVLSTVTNTVVGMWGSVGSGALVPLIGYLFYGLLSLYSLMIFIRIILSYTSVNYGSKWMRFLIRMTEPLLAPLRRKIPPMGMFDVSPIVAFILVWIVQVIVQGTMLKGMPIRFVG